MLVTVELATPPVRHRADGPAQGPTHSGPNGIGAASAALILMSERRLIFQKIEKRNAPQQLADALPGMRNAQCTTRGVRCVVHLHQFLDSCGVEITDAGKVQHDSQLTLTKKGLHLPPNAAVRRRAKGIVNPDDCVTAARASNGGHVEGDSILECR